ncbi:MAG TPA: hypothetical protein GXX15_04870 [Clostridia bacterium]|nr:hypothetical protein [Clostridia bacterium]
MKSNLNEILNLIDNLSFAKKKIIYKKMQNEINSKLLDILEKTNERAEKYPISLEEITEEVEYIRGKRYEKN